MDGMQNSDAALVALVSVHFRSVTVSHVTGHACVNGKHASEPSALVHVCCDNEQTMGQASVWHHENAAIVLSPGSLQVFSPEAHVTEHGCVDGKQATEPSALGHAC